MGSLTFRFAGVCTHFRNGIVPGVPHRVVLCELTKFMVGSLQVEGQPDPPVLYYTTPHFAQLDIKAVGTSQCGDSLQGVWELPNVPDLLDIPNVLKDGDIQSNVRLQVVNATETGMTGNLDRIEHLRDFYPNYAPSSDVILNGRASCYIDFFGGCSWVANDDQEVPYACIRVATDGPPQLMITPLTSSAPAPVWMVPLPPNTASGDHFTMVVKNLEDTAPVGINTTFDVGAYDYLLHYLTGQGGIPQVIAKRTPGLPDSPTPLPNATLDDIGCSFVEMGNALLHNPQPARRRLAGPRLVTPACADSQYP